MPKLESHVPMLTKNQRAHARESGVPTLSEDKCANDVGFVKLMQIEKDHAQSRDLGVKR